MAGFDPNFDPAGTGTRDGTVPAPGAIDGTRYFLRADRTWDVPPGGATPPAPGSITTLEYTCNIAGYITYSILQQAMQRVVDTIVASNLFTDLMDLLFVAIPGVDVFSPELIAVFNTFFSTLGGLALIDVEAALANSGLWQQIVCAIYDAMAGNPVITDIALAAAATAIKALTPSTLAIRTAVATLTTDITAAAMVPMAAGASMVAYDCTLCGTSGTASGAPQTIDTTPNLNITDGTHTIKGTKLITVSGATVGGTAPDATLTVTPAVSSVGVTAPITNTGTSTAPVIGLTTPLPTADGGLGIDTSAAVLGTILANSGSGWGGVAPLADNLVVASDHLAPGGITFIALPASGAATDLASASVNIYSASFYSSTATTWANIDATNLNVTLVTGAHRVLVSFSARCTNSQLNGVVLVRVVIDGVPIGGNNGCACFQSYGTFAQGDVNFSFLSDPLTAGSHTFEMQWETNTGTMELFTNDGSTTRPCVFFSIVEQYA